MLLLFIFFQVPVSSFTYTSYDQVAFFTDTSTNSPTVWAWDLGAAGTSPNQNPEVFFPTPGTHWVSLTAENGSGIGNTFTDLINLTQRPSETRSIGEFFDLDGDGTNDLRVDNPSGCPSGDVKLTTVNGAMWDYMDMDYRNVVAGDVPAMIENMGSFCPNEGSFGLFHGYFIRTTNGSSAKIWVPEKSASSLRMEFEILIFVPVELMSFDVE